MQFKDYYEVLGVPRDATAGQIKQAFRRLARRFHPDVNRAPDAAARMSEINEAHTVLSDPQRRAAYDALGRGQSGQPFTPPPDWGSDFEFSEPAEPSIDPREFSAFFEELFGRMGRGDAAGADAPHRRYAPGRDPFRQAGGHHRARIALDLADAWGGATRQLTLRRPQFDADGRLQMRERTLDVQVPRGVRAGQVIRLAGQGEPGTGGAPAGDLLLEVQFRPHPRFRVNGADLEADLPVAPWEAALGAVLPLALPDGRVLKLRVPAGAQSGRRLTVRGQGLPAGPAGPAGDLDLRIRVLLPDAEDPRARRLYERMASELAHFDARAAAAADPPAS